MTYKQCPYKQDCQRYQHERIICTFLYNVCYYKRRIDENRERRRVSDLAEHLRKLGGQDKI